MASDYTKNPDPVDVYVGSKILFRRKELGLSQEYLADALDLSFQQIQKYESGANRVSASKLYLLAKALGCPFGYFVEGYSGDSEENASDTTVPSTKLDPITQLLRTSEGIDLAKAFIGIRNSTVRRKFLALAQSLAHVDSKDQQES